MPFDQSVFIPCRFVAFTSLESLIAVELFNAVANGVGVRRLNFFFRADFLDFGNDFGNRFLLVGKQMNLDGCGNHLIKMLRYLSLAFVRTIFADQCADRTSGFIVPQPVVDGGEMNPCFIRNRLNIISRVVRMIKQRFNEVIFAFSSLSRFGILSI